MFKWFDATSAVQFGEALAKEVITTLAASAKLKDSKFTAKTEKALLRAESSVRDFKAKESLNFYKKSKLLNAFLWKLQDDGCGPEHARELTQWLSHRL